MARIEKRLFQLGINLPLSSKPVAHYACAQRAGNLLYVSGIGPVIGGVAAYTGKLGRDLNRENGYEAARLSALIAISTLKAQLYDLDRIQRVISLQGFLACTDEFYDHPYVLDGASDLLIEVFGEIGQHARAAIGVNSLPFNIPVEIIVIVEFGGEEF